MNSLSRTELLIGKEGINILKNSTVGIFGVGGVGSFSAEALSRSGIGRLILVDGDDVHITNINRQIHALNDTIGIPKVEAMAERIRKINPSIEIISINKFYSPEIRNMFFVYKYDYIIDAIDIIYNKIDLILTVYNKQIPFISCMGAGNRIYPTKLQVCDINDTQICPLARIIRKELRKKGIKKGLKVVYSNETPIKPRYENDLYVGSFSFVPSTAGLIMAAEVVKDILNANSFSF